ncbi:MAG: hypothetical protein KBD53_06270 [Candidatus Omnitrophica bacterium]|nr:hypothetical protein [Candidatus Omnitrophota bacterium]
MPNKPIYLDKIDELEKVSIVRLKGNIDQQMIPINSGKFCDKASNPRSSTPSIKPLT